MSNSENDKLQKQILERQISDTKAADKRQAEADKNRNNPLPGSMGNDLNTKGNLRD